MAGAAWFTWEGIHVRELAMQIARESCSINNVQLLDGTATPAGFAIKRGMSGRWGIQRTFLFEFSSTGDNRLKGRIVMDGKRRKFLDLENLYMEEQSQDSPDSP